MRRPNHVVIPRLSDSARAQLISALLLAGGIAAFFWSLTARNPETDAVPAAFGVISTLGFGVAAKCVAQPWWHRWAELAVDGDDLVEALPFWRRPFMTNVECRLGEAEIRVYAHSDGDHVHLAVRTVSSVHGDPPTNSPTPIRELEAATDR